MPAIPCDKRCNRSSGLIDRNYFYVSCERVYRPDPEVVLVIVLSNDACAVSRQIELAGCGIIRKAHLPLLQPQTSELICLTHDFGVCVVDPVNTVGASFLLFC